MAINSPVLFVVFTVINCLETLLLLLRLLFRLHIRRFWWEDMWAAVVFVCGTTSIVVKIIVYRTLNHETGPIATWTSMVTFTCAVWAARMSLLYSAIRVMSPLSFLRKLTRVISAFFFIVWTTLIVLKTWWCEDHAVDVPTVQGTISTCQIQNVIVCLQVVTDCISDPILVILSLKLFWRVKLPRRQRRMILSLFSSGIVMSVFSIFHAIAQYGPMETVESLSFNLEMTSVLIVCNLLVVVTYMYRVILTSRHGTFPSESESSSDDDDFTTRNPVRTTELLTTVDLSALTDYSSFTNSVGSSVHRSATP